MAEKKGCKGYSGSISNKGAQKVNAVFAQSASKAGKIKSGADLRTKGGK